MYEHGTSFFERREGTRGASARRRLTPRSAGAAVLAFGLLLSSLAAAPAALAASPAANDIGPAGPTVTWAGTAAGAASAGEATCVEGANCDTFTLNVTGSPADWAGKIISLRISWALPTDDYDLYVHKDSNSGALVGQSGNGAPGTEERSAIDPSSTGTGAYTVHVVYFTVTPGDQYQGTAEVQAKPIGRTASYVKGGATFSPNVTLRIPVASRDGEPSSRTDRFGNTYVSGIRGVPAGIDLWYFDLQPGSRTYDPYMRNPLYRGQPDRILASDSASVGADGGGDVDLAVGFDNAAPGKPPTLAYSSLVAANISTGTSADKGATFQLNPAGNATGGVPADDRQWLEFAGKSSVYLLYRTLEPAVTQIQKSKDGGLTYGPARTAGAIGQVGTVDVHQATGTVYISGSTGTVCVGTPDPLTGEPLTYDCHVAATDPAGVANIFFVVKVADDGTPNGTAYAAYSNGKDIFLTHSTDKGVNWSPPVRVSDGPETRTSLFPWIETGPTPGSVGVVWYGTSAATNNDDADWQVFFAQSFDATSATPTFRQVVASDHFIHGSNISTGGTLGTANRNLIDYFQISFDPTGAAVIAYTDDHNDFDGHTYVTRQVAGPSIKGGSVPAPAEGSALPARQTTAPDAPQVTDFAQDVATGLLGVVPANDPLDILSIKYSCETDPAVGPMIAATMKVSDLSVVPPYANWRMNFAANAPHSQLSPTGDYSFGLADRGDQFYVRASTDATGAQSFTWGTAARASNGDMAYTERGGADGGSFDPATGTITVKVAVSKLNALVTHGPAIGAGSILAGLRGEAFTSSNDVNAKRDLTRGGTQFVVGDCMGGSAGGGGGSEPSDVVKVTGAGSIYGKVVSFQFECNEALSGRLNYKDTEQGVDFYATSFTSYEQTGPDEVRFRGTGVMGRSPVTFEVTVRDNGEPGTEDTFRIVVTGAASSTRDGKLSQGNIQAHH